MLKKWPNAAVPQRRDCPCKQIVNPSQATNDMGLGANVRTRRPGLPLAVRGDRMSMTTGTSGGCALGPTPSPCVDGAPPAWHVLPPDGRAKTDLRRLIASGGSRTEKAQPRSGRTRGPPALPGFQDALARHRSGPPRTRDSAPRPPRRRRSDKRQRPQVPPLAAARPVGRVPCCPPESAWCTTAALARHGAHAGQQLGQQCNAQVIHRYVLRRIERVCACGRMRPLTPVVHPRWL